jgi:hypothetical protein
MEARRMIRRIIYRWKLERALAKRRRNRKAYSAAAKRGAATVVHKAYARDVMIQAAGAVA